MNLDDSLVIEHFFLTYHDIFTLDFFWKTLKANKVKISKEGARSILESSDMVFSL